MSTGNWKSPNFTNEFFETGRFEGEGIYKISFWVKNPRTTFNISGGGIASKEGEIKTLIEVNEQRDEWRPLEYSSIDVPKDRWLRI